MGQVRPVRTTMIAGTIKARTGGTFIPFNDARARSRDHACEEWSGDDRSHRHSCSSANSGRRLDSRASSEVRSSVSRVRGRNGSGKQCSSSETPIRASLSPPPRIRWARGPNNDAPAPTRWRRYAIPLSTMSSVKSAPERIAPSRCKVRAPAKSLSPRQHVGEAQGADRAARGQLRRRRTAPREASTEDAERDPPASSDPARRRSRSAALSAASTSSFSSRR